MKLASRCQQLTPKPTYQCTAQKLATSHIVCPHMQTLQKVDHRCCQLKPAFKVYFGYTYYAAQKWHAADATIPSSHACAAQHIITRRLFTTTPQLLCPDHETGNSYALLPSRCPQPCAIATAACPSTGSSYAVHDPTNRALSGGPWLQSPPPLSLLSRYSCSITSS